MDNAQQQKPVIPRIVWSKNKYILSAHHFILFAYWMHVPSVHKKFSLAFHYTISNPDLCSENIVINLLPTNWEYLLVFNHGQWRRKHFKFYFWWNVSVILQENFMNCILSSPFINITLKTQQRKHGLWSMLSPIFIVISAIHNLPLKIKWIQTYLAQQQQKL